MKFLPLVIVSMLSATVGWADQHQDCSHAQIQVNVNDQTDKEGLLKVMKILSDEDVLNGFKLALPPFDGMTGTRPSESRLVRISFDQPYPNGTPEYKEIGKRKMNEAAEALKQIPGVVVQCEQISGGFPRMSGGF